MSKFIFISFLSILCFCPLWAIAQEALPGEEATEEARPASPGMPGEVVELEAAEIKVTIEKPQVLLFSNRIKPQFDEVNLEKTFLPEIIGESETFVFDFSDSKQPVERIDIEKLLRKY